MITLIPKNRPRARVRLSERYIEYEETFRTPGKIQRGSLKMAIAAMQHWHWVEGILGYDVPPFHYSYELYQGQIGCCQFTPKDWDRIVRWANKKVARKRRKR